MTPVYKIAAVNKPSNFGENVGTFGDMQAYLMTCTGDIMGIIKHSIILMRATVMSFLIIIAEPGEFHKYNTTYIIL